MSDGRVDIETRLDTGHVRSDVQRVNNELGRIGNNMGRTASGMRNEMGRGMQGMVGDSEYYARQYRRAYGNEIGGLMGDIGGSYRYMSVEARGMMMEMRQGFHAQKMAMIPFKEDQIKATYGFYQMAQGSRDFQGTNQAFIGQANEIGKAMKASQDAQINANRLAMMGMLQTIGAMNAMSSAASKTTKNLDAMKNPLYNTARPALALVDSLDRVARSGSAAQIALELHGPQASMKTLTDETMRLNTILMGLPFLAIGVGASMLFMYGGLHKANMEMDPKYAETFKNMLEKITEALKPMRDAFTAVMVPIYKFVTKLAELTIAFNEAHPVMARFIQGTIMLVPALMALLFPLALGVGYFKGLRAILFALRPLIMPVATAFATLSAPVWITAAAIAGLTVGLTHFYKTNEKFKNFVDGTVKAVVNFSKALYQNGVDLAKAAYNSDLVQNSIKKMQTALTTAGTKTMEFGSNVLSLGKYLAFAAIDGDHFNDWVTHLPDSWQNAAMAMGQSIVNMRTNMISLFGTTMQLGKDLMQLGSYLTNVALTGNIFSDALNALPPSVQGLANSIAPAMLAVNSFGQSIVALGKYFYFAALDGDNMNDFITHLPVSWQNAAMAVGNVIATMSTSFQSLFGPLNDIGNAFLNFGRYILSVISTGDLMNGWLNLMPVGFQIAGVLIGNAILTIKTAISSLVEAVRLALGGDTSQLGQIFMTILPTLIGMLLGGLPALLITASHFLPTIVEGMNTMLPFLTSAITNVITGIVTVITTYLPQFLEQGVKILTFLINGVVQVLPVVVATLVQVAVELVNSLVNTIGTLLPLILDAGIKILMAVIDGIIKSLPQIINAAIQMITTLVNAIANLLPQILNAGIQILGALINGIMQVLPNLLQTAVMLVTKVAEMLIQNLPKIIEAGMKILIAIVEGIVKVLPQLIQTAIQLIVKIVDTIMQNLPKILAAGVQILTMLIRGIIQILPQLISTALSLIVKIAQTIIANLPQILNAGIQILRMLIQGILSLVGQLLSTITTNVIGGIKNCFSNAGTMLTGIGKNIIQGLINGISSMVGSAVSTVKRVASNIKDGIADFFDIHSPSRVTYALGEFVTEGLANGVVGMTKYAVKKARTLAESVMDGFAALKEDIVMGDFIEGNLVSDTLQNQFANSKRFVNDLVQVNPTPQQTRYNAPKQEQQVKTTSPDNNQSNQGNTYIVLDKKVVGEALAQPVETTNNRRKQRLAQFKPTVTPSF
ncbi:carbamoyl-phosphate synthase large subunit [Bacillus sp. TH19]|uniref:carbamoyl-phosphate synthase large subunit n=1 Tax=Bacillus sp. TH19 TaxID=2796385 RepID=UPI001913502D|nr:carbamoyl-phosphate synthase large subunit [Bacillus sp. TH19]MBK5474348.1 carbamoyl-phosphate synthase large subunit [Bacillus sp. TH19]